MDTSKQNTICAQRIWSIVLSTILAFLVLGGLLGWLGSPQPARAATLVVTNAADSGPGSLRQAISDAAVGDTITFDSSYVITLTSTLVLSQDLTIDGGGHTIILNGDVTGDGYDSDDTKPFQVNAGVSATLQNLTITGGGLGGPDSGGVGAIFNQGTLTVTNSTLSNSAFGIINEISATLIVSNSHFDSNFAGNSWLPMGKLGGAITNEGVMTVTGSAFTGNTAYEGAGAGAIYNHTNGTVTIKGCTFDSNVSIGMFAGALRNIGTMTVDSSVFTNNVSDGTPGYGLPGGGAISNYTGFLTVTNSTFSNNIATTSSDTESPNGGAIYSFGYLTVENSTFQGNTASTGSGGAIYSGFMLGSLTNNTFLGNSAIDGGALWVYPFSDPNYPPVFFTNNTFISNTATTSATVWLKGSGYLYNNIVAQSAAGGNCVIEAGSVFTATGNLADDNTCGAGFTNSPSINPGPLGDYGGGTQTIPLLPGSSAIDMGDDAHCPAADQRGVTRPQGAGCDIGAYEVSNVLYAAPGGATSGHCVNWATACELRYALSRAVDGQEIWTAAGTYKPTGGTDRNATFLLKNGVTVYGGFGGTETARDQRDPAANPVTLSGDLNGDDGPNFANNTENSYHVVTGVTGATLDGVIISGGNANSGATCPSASCGGGMYNINGSRPTLTNVTISGNAATYGGGMYNYLSSNPALTNVTFSGNAAASGGGGLRNYASSPTLINVTFSGNLATGASNGGGMYNFYGSSPKLINVTFSGNSATSGGGMYNASNSNPQVQNSIFWGNTGGQITNSGSTPVITDSVVQGGYAGGTNILTANPLLGSLGNYGGSTQTTPLLPGSAAIDAGSACPATDQRDVARTGMCDMGAFESQGFTLAITSGNNQVTIPSSAFPDPLALSVTANDPIEPVNGGRVRFDAPASGASTIPVTATLTIAGGAVSHSVTANSRGGVYAVVARAAGAADVNFALTNLYPVLYAVPGGAIDELSDCESWAAACELRRALSISITGQEIWVAAGTYQPGLTGDRPATFQLRNGVALYGGFAGNESLRDARNPITHASILSGDLNGNGRDTNDAYHVVTGSGTDATAALDGFTIQGGYANGAAPHNYGAGMVILDGAPTLRHLIFTGNATGTTSSFAGGGLYLENGSPALSDLTFDNNYAYNGGGLFIRNCSPSLTRLTFRANVAQSAGGGLYNANGSATTLTNAIFTGNQAYAGAGVYNSASAPKLFNVSFAGNTSANGAALRNQSKSYPVLKNAIIWGNSGVAILDQDSYAIYTTVSNSIIQGGYPGAINADPLFVDADGLDNIYGSADDNLRLQFSSPAIETGTNTVCPATDLDGLPRPSDGNADGPATCDMGAYEAGEMICSAPYTFANQSGVSIQVTTPGDLACLYVDEMEVSHPEATTGLQTGRYWLIEGRDSGGNPATGFEVTLTLPTTFTPDAGDKVCRYTGGQVWDCAATSHTNAAITRDGITAFSDWAVSNAAAPAAVTGVGIARLSDSQVQVTWDAAAGATGYEVWYAANTPYFAPGPDCAQPAPYSCIVQTTTSFTHAALGDPASHYTYLVRAVNDSGASPRSEPPVGEFEFNLTPGGSISGR